MFQWLIRWAIAFEAGWELGDWFTVVLPSIRAGTPLWMPMIHHFTLYGGVPCNLYIVNSACGREVALLIIVLAGSMGPIGVLQFVRSILSWTDPYERVWAQIVTVCVGAGYIVTRGPLWLWLCQRPAWLKSPMKAAVV